MGEEDQIRTRKQTKSSRIIEADLCCKERVTNTEKFYKNFHIYIYISLKKSSDIFVATLDIHSRFILNAKVYVRPSNPNQDGYTGGTLAFCSVAFTETEGHSIANGKHDNHQYVLCFFFFLLSQQI